MSLMLLFEILINVYQGFLMVYFLRRRLHIAREGHIPDILCAGAVALFFSLYLFKDIPTGDTVVFIFPLIYSLFVSDEKRRICFFWNFVMAVLFVLSATATSAIYLSLPKAAQASPMMQPGVRVSFVIASNAMLTLALFAASHWGRNGGLLSWRVVAVFSLQIVLLWAMTEILFMLRLRIAMERDFSFVAACLAVMVCCVLCLLLYDVFAKNTERQVQLQTEIERLRITRQHQDELQSVYDHLVAFRHDLKHQMQIIEQLIAEDHIQEANRYFEELRRAEQSLPSYTTGNTAVDALLTTKTLVIRRQGIALSYEPYPLRPLPIDDASFCAVVGNLLDNAVEGAGRVKDASVPRWIHLSFSRCRDMFFITCENTMDPSTLRRAQNRFISSKKGVLHGVGLASIERIAAEAKGYCRFIPKKDQFYAQVVLPFLPPNEKAAD